MKVNKKALVAILGFCVISLGFLMYKNYSLKNHIKQNQNKIGSLGYKERVEHYEKNFPNVKIIETPERNVVSSDSKYETFQLIKTFSVGSNSIEDENYIFSKVIDIKSDSKENFYVSEFSESYPIRKYNKHGIYIRQIGRRGQGPSEYGMHTLIAISPEDSIYLFSINNMQISLYLSDNTFVRAFRLEGYQLKGPPAAFITGVDGRFYFTAYDHSEQKVIHVFDRLGKYIQSFGEPVLTNNNDDFPNSQIVRICSPGQLFVKTKSVFYSQLNPCEIRFYTSSGLLKRVILNKEHSKNIFRPIRRKDGAYLFLPPWGSRWLGCYEDLVLNYVQPYLNPNTQYEKSKNIANLYFYTMKGLLVGSVELSANIAIMDIDARGSLYCFDNEESSIKKYDLKIN